MFKSMTAYGRATHFSAFGRFVAEIHSLNRKHLEINTHLPSELMRFDAEIKRWISEQIGRGQVNLKISVVFNQFTPLRISANLPLIRQYHLAWKELLHDTNINDSDEAFLHMVSHQDIFIHEQQELEEAHCRKVLQELISQALIGLKSMKEQEGQLLYDDIFARFARLPPLIKEIALKAPDATQRFRDRLISKVSAIMGSSVENEERILKEISIYAEKVDIEEELTRLGSHFKQTNELMSAPVEGVGKILEFLVQEFNREVNTIGSKSSSIDVSRHVVEIKSELERIREQLQNIE